MRFPRLPVWLSTGPSDRRGYLWLALVLLVGFTFIGVNFVLDLLYAVLDPRVRLG